MPNESRLDAAAEKVAKNPFYTVTGPLGFGGLVLAWQLNGIQDAQAIATQAQTQMQTELTVLGSKVDALKEANDSGGAERDALRSELSALRTRVTQLESDARAAKGSKRKR